MTSRRSPRPGTSIDRSFSATNTAWSFRDILRRGRAVLPGPLTVQSRCDAVDSGDARMVVSVCAGARHDIRSSRYAELDQIYNFACPASPVHCQHDPVQTTKTVVHGAIIMLGLA
jgi:hypothetical protein